MVSRELFDAKCRENNIRRAETRFSEHDYLFIKSAQSLTERLSFLKSPPDSVLIFGAREAYLYNAIKSAFPSAVITSISGTDISSFHSGSFACVISNLCLHTENNVPGLLSDVRRILKPDGVFLSSFFGENTLAHLRRCMIETESRLTCDVSPRVPPAIDIKSAGSVIQSAGFSLPAADCETFTVVHSDVISLLHDLRGMGETNILTSRSRRPLTKAFFEHLKENYAALCGNNEGYVETQFDILYIIGWKE